MSRIIWIGALALSWFTTVHGQAIVIDQGNVTKESNTFYGGSNIQTKELPSLPAQGSIYLYDLWQTADLTFKSGFNFSEMIKVNIYFNEVYFEKNEVLMSVSLRDLDNFSIRSSIDNKNHVFVNGADYGIEEGLLEIVLKNDKASLFKWYQILVKEANYSAQFDAGSRSDTYLRRETYYLQFDGKMYQIKRKGDLYLDNETKFTDKIKSYVKKNKPNVKVEKDIIEFVKFLNGTQA